LAALVVLMGMAPGVATGRTIDFPYKDATLLPAGHAKSARLWVPNTARRDRTYTLVVLLHGLNKAGRKHPLLGGSAGVDVPALATRLIRSGQARQRFVLAGPTQIRGAAHSDTLWRRFDLPGFVRAVRRNLPRGIRIADRVVVMGHSGAGCTPGSGLWWVARRHGKMLRALGTMDTCMDAAFGRHLRSWLWPKRQGGKGSARVWLINFWQAGWRRDVQGFERALGFELLQERGPRGLRLLKRNRRRWLSARVDFAAHGHRLIVERIFKEALLRLFPTRATLRRLERELAAAERAARRRERRSRRRR